MNSEPSAPFSCTIFPALPSDVERAFHDLSRDMDPKLVHVFLDKLQRYAAKPDRALFLAEHGNNIIGFATIINHSEAPEGVDAAAVDLLRNYACGTGLMVLPEFRRRGVASLLVRYWEQWAQENGLSGIWVVTRQMGDWYRHCFQFSVLGTTVRHATEKIVLAKNISRNQSVSVERSRTTRADENGCR